MRPHQQIMSVVEAAFTGVSCLKQCRLCVSWRHVVHQQSLYPVIASTGPVVITAFLLQIAEVIIQEAAPGADQVTLMLAKGAAQHPDTATAMYNCYYRPYIARQQQEVIQLQKDEALAVPVDLDYNTMYQLSGEDKEKLTAARPRTLAQAQRIPGVTPQAVMLLLQMIKRHQHGAHLMQRPRQAQASAA